MWLKDIRKKERKKHLKQNSGPEDERCEDETYTYQRIVPEDRRSGEQMGK